MTRTGMLWLAVAILAALSAMTPAQHRARKRHLSHPAKSASQLRNTLKNLRSQKAELEKQLRTTKVQTHVVLGDIYKVDAALDEVEGQLEDTTSRLSSSRDDQKALGVQLVDATAKLDATREQVRRRLRHMYVSGNAASISAFVGTKSVGDVASRRFLLQMIAKSDRQLFTDYQHLRDLVASRKHRQDELVVRINDLMHRQAEQQADLKVKRNQKGEILKSLRSKQGQIQQMLRQLEADEREVGAEIAAFERRKRRPGEKALPAFHGRLSRPVAGALTSGFGMRYHPVLHITRLHAGVDFHASPGTAIHAAADGEVIVAQYSTSYGNFVVIDHGGGISTLYAHCSRLMVHSGESVHRGQEIALSGATGLVAGPHLHFEVRVNGRPVNPIGWL